MNNKGDVVGQSSVSRIYKNKESNKVVHAVLWKNGEVFDVSAQSFPKAEYSAAIDINGNGDILLRIGAFGAIPESKYVLTNSNTLIKLTSKSVDKINNSRFSFFNKAVLDWTLAI